MENPIHIELLEASKEDFNNYYNLPFAVYVTSKEGLILKMNDKASELLEIDINEANNYNINNFYTIKGDRDRLINELEKYPNKTWKNNDTLNFNVNGNVISLRFFAKTFKNNDVFLGSLCLVFQITEFERFRSLEQHMPVGFFEISENNLISNSNDKFKEILDIKENSSANIIDYLGANDGLKTMGLKEQMKKKYYTEIIKELRDKGYVKDKIIDFVKSDGTRIVGKVNLQVEGIGEDKIIYRVKGFLEDITFKEILKDVQDLHVGLFIVKNEGNSLLITHYNDFFGVIFEKKQTQTFIGENFSKLINNQNEYNIFLDKLISDEKISNYLLKSSVGNNVKDLSIHIKKITRNNSVKFAGAIYDVTNDVERNLTEIKLNFGSFLHSYSAMSNNVKDTLKGIIDAHGTEVVIDSKLNTLLAFKNIQDNINGFITNYKIYYDDAKDKGFLEENNEKINTLLRKLQNKLSNYGVSKVSVAFIRNTFIRIRDIVENFGPNDLISNKNYRAVSRDITNIFRFSRLLSLDYLENESFDMIIDVEEFKETLRANATVPENKKFYLMDALNRAKQNLEEFADRKNIELKINSSYHNNNILLKGDERNLFTAFYNIINNAIKYSWQNNKNEDKQSTVIISVKDDALYVAISITNQGVGIKKSELLSGELFKFGNRGQFNTDKTRKGNGIGLWHSNNIILQFNGNISIVSEPVDPNFPNDFKRPFNTTFIITLPKKFA